MSSLEKKRLRKAFFEEALKLDWEDLSLKVVGHLELFFSEYLKEKPGLLLGGYRGKKYEINIDRFLKASPDVTFFFPRVCDYKQKSMQFYQARAEIKEDWEWSRFGILEPKGALCSIPEVFLVPCLMMSFEGDRLGYGQGFYDRYLGVLENRKTLGVLPSIFLKEKLPRALSDTLLDGYVSEKGVFVKESFFKEKMDET